MDYIIRVVKKKKKKKRKKVHWKEPENECRIREIRANRTNDGKRKKKKKKKKFTIVRVPLKGTAENHFSGAIFIYGKT